MSDEEKEEVRVSSYGRGGFSFCGLTDSEVEAMQGMTNGQAWAIVSDGRLKTHDAREPLPSPAEDEEMLPFWRRPLAEEKSTQLELLKPDFAGDSDMPGIVISHLCGYYYTPENYAKQAKLLESYGFECLRSRRGKDGKFWEQWVLPSFWSAQGELKNFLDTVKGDKKAKQLDEVIDFLCGHVSFGTLDVSAQRAAMVMND